MNRHIEAAPGSIDVSVIIPVGERPEDLAELYAEYSQPLRAHGWVFEFIFISGPTYEHLLVPLMQLAAAGEPVRVLEVAQSLGDAALIKIAAEKCEGSIIVILAAYRRIAAEGLPLLVKEVESGAELAAACRWPQSRSLVNRLQNGMFHMLLSGLTQDRLHDIASGVSAVRRSLLQELPIYGDFGRFLPVVALREGYRVVEVQAARHPRDERRRIYAPGTYLRRLIDVLGLYFLLRFLDKPLRFFGLVGSFLVSMGLVALVTVTLARIDGQGIADRPLLLLGVLLVVIGVQGFALGLVGEIVVHLHAPRRRPYRLWSERAHVKLRAMPPPTETTPGAGSIRTRRG